MHNFIISFFILLITCSTVYANEFPAESKPWWNESYGMIAGLGFADDRTGELHSVRGHFGGFWTNSDYLYQLDISISEAIYDRTTDAGEIERFNISESITFHVGEFGYWYAANGFAMIGGGITKRYEKQKECIPDEFSDDCGYGLNAFVHIDPMDVQYGLGLHVALGKLWL